MFEPLTSIAVALGVHLGEKVIDRFWAALSSGHGAYATAAGVTDLGAGQQGPTYLGLGAPGGFAMQELVVGDLYFPESMYLPTDAAPVLLAVNEGTGEAALVGEMLDEGGFQVALPHGIYSFYAFVLGLVTDDAMAAPIYAMGFPSAIDLQDSAGFTFDGDEGDFWSMFIDHPLQVFAGGPYILDFILISPSDVEGLPQTLGDFFGETGYGYPDLSGAWDLHESYEFGSTQAQMFLLQRNDHITGFVVTHDLMDDGSEFLLRESVQGRVVGGNLVLQGTDVEIIAGESDDYVLDRWEGTILQDGTITGYSEDLAGTSGQFIMARS